MIFFFRNHVENMGGRPVPELFLFFKKALCELKEVVCGLVSIYFDSPELKIQ